MNFTYLYVYKYYLYIYDYLLRSELITINDAACDFSLQ